MIEKLLHEIRSGGTLQPAALAARLNTSVGLISMMLEDLERRGLLTQFHTQCSSGCGQCSLSSGCSTSTREKGRVWIFKKDQT